MTNHPRMNSFSEGLAARVPHHHVIAQASHFILNYHAGTLNYCPGCAGTQWLIGRTMAQCAHCDTALPLAQMAQTPVRPLFISRSSATAGRC